jgi:hypothetical protein
MYLKMMGGVLSLIICGTTVKMRQNPLLKKLQTYSPHQYKDERRV